MPTLPSWCESLGQADVVHDAGRLLQLSLWAEEKLCLGDRWAMGSVADATMRPPGASELLQQGHAWLAGVDATELF